MRVPEARWARELQNWTVMERCRPADFEAMNPGSSLGWRPARPIGAHGFRLFRRLKLAFLVFAGRYDALRWR